MKKELLVISTLSLMGINLVAQEKNSYTLDDFNKSIPIHGVAWQSYTPSFYLGLAPRVENPEMIHIRIARGNQVRVTAILEASTLENYLYTLDKREQVYNLLFTNKVIAKAHNNTDVEKFSKIINSDKYKIKEILSKHAQGEITNIELQKEALEVLKKLNPGRVFEVRVDLSKRLTEWQQKDLEMFLSKSKSINRTSLRKQSREVNVLLNEMLPGRVNINHVSDEMLDALVTVVNDRSSFKNVVSLFGVVTNKKFDQFIKTNDDRLILNMNEFTGVYPAGTVLASVTDNQGNNINRIRTTGAMYFKTRSGRDVDNIHAKPFYGWIPKLDYEMVGNAMSNGMHNPAVRFNLKSSTFSWLNEKLNIAQDLKNIWLVARGGVSHGCIRLAAGHALEIRNILPSMPEKIMEVFYHGNLSTDYDVFDVDGDGQAEVMGVEYYVNYSLAGGEGEARYTAKSLSPDSFKKEEFYKNLYGANGQFITGKDGEIIFNSPSVSYFNSDGNPNSNSFVAKPFSVSNKFSNIKLYEQKYEQEKIQFYKKVSGNDFKFIQVLGRITACAPENKANSECSESEFDRQFKAVLNK